MNDWTNEERIAIGGLDEIRVAGRRADGTLRKPVIIWVVPYQMKFYVRSVGGREAGWFRGVQERHEGHLWAGGHDRDVAFADAAHELDERIDEVYRAKYGGRYPANIVDSIMRPEARAATLEVIPR